MAKRKEKQAAAGVADSSPYVRKFNKNKRAAEFPSTLGLVKALYPAAIEYTGIPKGMRGMIGTLFAVLGAMICWLGWTLGDLAFHNDASLVAKVGTGLMIALAAALLLVMAVLLRYELFSPEDLPVVFDRGSGKVHLFHRDVPPGWLGVFRPWPTVVRTLDWKLVHAEYRRGAKVDGARDHALVFNAHTSSTDPGVACTFMVGNPAGMVEPMVLAGWEHIRRFMEEQGPHLPLGEKLLPYTIPATTRECLAMFGESLRATWTNDRWLVFLMLPAFPVVLPCLVLVGVFAWLSYMTSTPVPWPQALRDALGTRTTAAAPKQS